MWMKGVKGSFSPVPQVLILSVVLQIIRDEMSVSSHASWTGGSGDGNDGEGPTDFKLQMALERRRTMETMEPGEKKAMRKSIQLTQDW